MFPTSAGSVYSDLTPSTYQDIYQEFAKLDSRVERQYSRNDYEQYVSKAMESAHYDQLELALMVPNRRSIPTEDVSDYLSERKRVIGLFRAYDAFARDAEFGILYFDIGGVFRFNSNCTILNTLRLILGDKPPIVLATVSSEAAFNKRYESAIAKMLRERGNILPLKCRPGDERFWVTCRSQ
jgi:hypothetical protein